MTIVSRRNGTVLEWGIHLVMALAAFLYVKFFRPMPAPIDPVPGERMIELVELTEQEYERTLVLALAPSCPYCLVSRPFYKDLITQRNKGEHKIQVVAVVDTNASVTLQKDVLHDGGVYPDTVMVLSFQDAHIIGVPTLVALNEEAVIENVWIGRLDEQRELDVLAALGLDTAFSINGTQ
ncbi:MAG: hypothetical protein OXF48_10965 [Bacteroidetes bacterium]|nr:hypothetical protein [Bacteroidota bacterium]